MIRLLGIRSNFPAELFYAYRQTVRAGIVKLILAVSAAMTLPAATAQGQRTLSLEDCLREGMQNNYDVRIARSRERIASNNNTAAPFLPALTAGARQSADRYHQTDAFPAPQDDIKSDYANNTYNVDLQLGWRLFDGMAMFATRETSRELLKAGQLNLRASMEGLAADIASQYCYIVTQRRRLDASELYLEISTLRYQQAKEKYIVGSISGLEREQARIDFNSDSSKLVRQQEVLRNAYLHLFELINAAPGTQATLGDSIVPDGGLRRDELLHGASERNTSILLARSGQRVSDLDLRVARSSAYPTLDFNASYRYNYAERGSQEQTFTQYHGPTFGFTASMKLFDRLDTRRKIRNAETECEIAGLEYEQARARVENSIEQLYNTYRKNIMMISFEDESAATALLNLQTAVVMYRLGTISGVEFREIQRSYLEAEERKIDAVFNAKISEIGLLLLAGDIL